MSPEYLTEAFAHEAAAFIDRHATEPFFLYTPLNAPHTPLQATKRLLDRFPNVQDESRRVYSATRFKNDPAATRPSRLSMKRSGRVLSSMKAAEQQAAKDLAYGCRVEGGQLEELPAAREESAL